MKKTMKQNRFACVRRHEHSETGFGNELCRVRWWVWDRLKHVYVMPHTSRSKAQEVARNLSAIFKMESIIQEQDNVKEA